MNDIIFVLQYGQQKTHKWLKSFLCVPIILLFKGYTAVRIQKYDLYK